MKKWVVASAWNEAQELLPKLVLEALVVAALVLSGVLYTTIGFYSFVISALVGIGVAGYVAYVFIRLYARLTTFLNELSTKELVALESIYSFWVLKKSDIPLYLSTSLLSCFIKRATSEKVFLKWSYAKEPTHVWEFVLNHEYMHAMQEKNNWTLSEAQCKALKTGILNKYTTSAKTAVIREIDADVYAVLNLQKRLSIREFKGLLQAVFQIELGGRTQSFYEFLAGEGTQCRVLGLKELNIFID